MRQLWTCPTDTCPPTTRQPLNVTTFEDDQPQALCASCGEQFPTAAITPVPA